MMTMGFEAEVMGGWLQIDGAVDVHGVLQHGVWNGLQVATPIERTYVQIKMLADPWAAINGKWSFLVVQNQVLLPERFTEGDKEYILLSSVIKPRSILLSLDGDEKLTLQLLHDALIFAEPGRPYSNHAREEWKQMVLGHLVRRGYTVPNLERDNDG